MVFFLTVTFTLFVISALGQFKEFVFFIADNKLSCLTGYSKGYDLAKQYSLSRISLRAEVWRQSSSRKQFGLEREFTIANFNNLNGHIVNTKQCLGTYLFVCYKKKRL